jgi:excisionase family DNA binding protein
MRTDAARRDRAVEPEPSTASTSLLDELMTASQMAAVLQMRVSTIEEYARRGLLPSVKLGRHRRFVRSQVEHAIVELLAR